jgi:hypothetical protein
MRRPFSDRHLKSISVGPNGSILTGTTGFLEVAVCLDVMAKAAWGFIQTINSRSLKNAMEKYESKKNDSNSRTKGI